MKKIIKISLSVLFFILLTPVLFFYDSIILQYILYYGFFAILITFPFAWFFYCYTQIKKNILAKNPWGPFVRNSTLVLSTVFIAITLYYDSIAYGMDKLGVMLVSAGFIGFVLINLLIQFLMGNIIKKNLS